MRNGWWRIPALLLVASPGVAMAQGPRIPDRFPVERPASPPGRRLAVALPDSVTSPRRDHRWLGTALGGIGLGIAGAIEGAAYCNNSENGPRSCTGTTIAFAAGGGAIGAVVGHVVGRLFAR